MGKDNTKGQEMNDTMKAARTAADVRRAAITRHPANGRAGRRPEAVAVALHDGRGNA